MKTLKQHHTFTILVILILTLSSCATLLNSRYTTLNLVTAQPSTVIIGKDTLKDNSSNRAISVIRNTDALKLTLSNDSLVKTVYVEPSNSLAYWANLCFFYGLGMLVEMDNPKRYTYPSMVYVDLTDDENKYLKFKPFTGVDDEYSNILKLTPLTLGGFVNPAFEITYERRTGKSLSTQLMASFLLPGTVLDQQNFRNDKKGFRVAIEEKFYFKKSAPFGPYFAFEIDYLNSRGTYNLNFGRLFTNTEEIVALKKQNYSFNLKFGYQWIVQRVSFDLYGGLGLRYKNVKYLDGTNSNGNNQGTGLFGQLNREGKYWTSSVPLNIRIGYTF